MNIDLITEQDLFEEISSLSTEAISAEFASIDTMSIEDTLTLINDQDQTVPFAVRAVIPKIADIVRHCVYAFQNGGRLIYLGAGTSGRMGILDAAECPPTFGVSKDLVQAFIAGGKLAVFEAVEGAEDNAQAGIDTISALNVSQHDVVCGLTASGRTPWVIAALQAASLASAYTVLITSNKAHLDTITPGSASGGSLEQESDLMLKSATKASLQGCRVSLLCVDVGPEVIAGSTRMKAATAQKLILNMITTTAMVQIGRTHKNLMVNLQPVNNKLKQRAKRIRACLEPLVASKLALDGDLEQGAPSLKREL